MPRPSLSSPSAHEKQLIDGAYEPRCNFLRCPWTRRIASSQLCVWGRKAHARSVTPGCELRACGRWRAAACVLPSAALRGRAILENGSLMCRLVVREPDRRVQVPQPDAEQPAATVEPVQPAAADANQPTAVVPEPVQPAAVVVQPLATTDAAAAAAVVDAAASLNEAISTAAAAQIGAIAAGISAEPQAAAALGGALAAAAAGGATAIAGMSSHFTTC